MSRGRVGGSVGLLVTALIVTGCARDAASPSALPSSAALPSAALPSFPASPSVGSGVAAAGSETVTGTVTAGVEANCLLLKGEGEPRQLIFDDPALRAKAQVGATVTVVGRADPGQITTCQQGVPFFVTSLRAS